jgi:hypothetical protein
MQTKPCKQHAHERNLTACCTSSRVNPTSGAQGVLLVRQNCPSRFETIALAGASVIDSSKGPRTLQALFRSPGGEAAFP